MNGWLRGRRVEHAMSQLSRTPAVTALVRLMVLLGFAVAAWLVASASAHADTTVPATSSVSASGSSGMAADTSSGDSGGVDHSTGSLPGAEAPDGQPVEGALVPVTRNLAEIVQPATAATGQVLAPVTSAVVGSEPAGKSNAGPSLQEDLLNPLGLSEAVAPLTDVLAPLSDCVRPVLSGTALLRPVQDTVSSLQGRGQAVKRPAPEAPQDVPAPARRGVISAETHQADASGAQDVRPFGHPVDARNAELPPSLPAGALFPRLLGVAGSGGSTSGPTAPTHDGGTGAFVTGTSAADAAISSISLATADEGAPRDRAEKLVVSPD